MSLSPNTYDYEKAYTRVVWHNLPSTESPINETNLNKADIGLNTDDNRIIQLNTVKAEKTDMLQALKSISYNDQTGVFIFTWFNDTTMTVDLNIEKIPVSFSMSPSGVITMTNADGTTYTADISELIKTYSFVDSSTIHYTVITDSSGNKTVTCDVKDGSITGNKLEPNYLADITTQASLASASATAANASANAAAYDAKLAQSYAVGGSGIRQDEDTDNADYYCAQAQLAKSQAETLVSDAADEVEAIIENAFNEIAPQVYVDLSTGHLMWAAGNFIFTVNDSTGHLLWGVV